jgi:large subunit ribosomal protein L1
MDNEKVLEAVREAISKSPERKFLESVELSINLRYIDLSDPKKRINEEILLPNGRGKPIKVAVFASGETALKAGKVADRVIMPEEIDSIVKQEKSQEICEQLRLFFG